LILYWGVPFSAVDDLSKLYCASPFLAGALPYALGANPRNPSDLFCMVGGKVFWLPPVPLVVPGAGTCSREYFGSPPFPFFSCAICFTSSVSRVAAPPCYFPPSPFDFGRFVKRFAPQRGVFIHSVLFNRSERCAFLADPEFLNTQLFESACPSVWRS